MHTAEVNDSEEQGQPSGRNHGCYSLAKGQYGGGRCRVFQTPVRKDRGHVTELNTAFAKLMMKNWAFFLEKRQRRNGPMFFFFTRI